VRDRGRLGENDTVPIVYRDGFCERVSIAGACPTGDDDAMVSASVAGVYGLALGADLPSPYERGAAPMHVVGIYTPLNPADPYWGDSLLTVTERVGTSKPDAVYVSRGSFVAHAANVTVERVLVLSGYLPDLDLISTRYLDASALSHEQGFSVDSQLPTLLNQIVSDQNDLSLTVPAVVAEIVLIGLFALFLALRAIGTDRRADVGLVLLRGLPAGRIRSLLVAQHAIPMFVAAPIGAAVGLLVASYLGGPVHAPGRQRLALLAAAGAALLVLLGSLLAAVVAERRRRGTPITDLLRMTPPRRRGWRSDAVDVAVLAVAVAAIVQAEIATAAVQPGLVTVLPAFTAVIVALIGARLVAPVAGRFARQQLRAGRISGLLTVTYLARRPGLDRMFALLAIGAALTGAAVVTANVAAEARAQRSAVELGADRVVAVHGASPGALLAATRAADPEGRYLMAATTFRSNLGDTDVIALDSSRLARVLSPGADPGGPDGARLATLLHPENLTQVTLTGTRLTLTATMVSGASLPLYVVATLVAPDSSARYAVFGPMRAHATTYDTTAAACAGGCRFVGFELSTHAGHVPDVSGAPIVGSSVRIAGLAADGTAAGLSLDDLLHWRATDAPNAIGPVTTAGKDGLTLSFPVHETYAASALDAHVRFIDAPVPVPVVAAGRLASPGIAGVPRLRPFATVYMPVRVVATESIVPALGFALRLLMENISYRGRLKPLQLIIFRRFDRNRRTVLICWPATHLVVLWHLKWPGNSWRWEKASAFSVLSTLPNRRSRFSFGE
jgi:hypothetical protein